MTKSLRYGHRGVRPEFSEGLSGLIAIERLVPPAIDENFREGVNGILLRTAGAFGLMTVAMTLVFYLVPDLRLWRGNFAASDLTDDAACRAYNRRPTDRQGPFSRCTTNLTSR